jgi:hypothetical protein
MRKLIYVPIIHSVADMGTMGDELKRKSVSGLGENVWQKHTETVVGYWEAIESYFENSDLYVRGIKIYQDGMFVDGEMAMKLIRDGVKSGSKNSEIVSNLIDRGAILMKTEDFKMVKDEYDGLQSIMKSKTNIRKLIHLLRYKLLKPIFLRRRDRFIAATIDETLESNETGILFIGAYHNVMNWLPKDITVIELKEVEKIRKYQKAIQSRSKIKVEQLERLIQYMVKKMT